MAWTTVICNDCGDEYQVQMYWPKRTREWKVKSWCGICEDCREAMANRLLAENKSGELTELTGTDKQIVWAMQIRSDLMRLYEKTADGEDGYTRYFGRALKDAVNLPAGERTRKAKEIAGSLSDKDIKDLAAAASAELFENHSAHWWIENRDEDVCRMVAGEMAKLLLGGQKESQTEEAIQAEVEAEAVIKPESPVTETIADIRLKEDYIEISFKERNDDFKSIIKNHGYRWDTPWKKDLSYATERPEDRVAEIGHTLLSNGFCIRVMDQDIRKKIIAGDFEQEHTRWIGVLKNKPEHFYIKWRRDDNMYDAARGITGSRYDSPGVTVPMEHVDEVKDFAEMYKFRFSPSAKELVEQAETNKSAALTVKLDEKKKESLPVYDGIPRLDIPENVEVNDALKD